MFPIHKFIVTFKLGRQTLAKGFMENSEKGEKYE